MPPVALRSPDTPTMIAIAISDATSAYSIDASPFCLLAGGASPKASPRLVFLRVKAAVSIAMARWRPPQRRPVIRQS